MVKRLLWHTLFMLKISFPVTTIIRYKFLTVCFTVCLLKVLKVTANWIKNYDSDKVTFLQGDDWFFFFKRKVEIEFFEYFRFSHWRTSDFGKLYNFLFGNR